LKDNGTLIYELAKGSIDAYECIYNMHYTHVYSCVFKIIKDNNEAREITQDTFVSLWENRSKLKKNVPIKYLLFKMAHNDCLNRFKHQKVRERYLSEECYLLEASFYENFENTYDPDLLDQIKSAVEELPKKNQEVFKLRYYKSLNTKEVADKLTITPRTVETHISNALRILRDKFKHAQILMIFLFVFEITHHIILFYNQML